MATNGMDVPNEEVDCEERVVSNTGNSGGVERRRSRGGGEGEGGGGGDGSGPNRGSTMRGKGFHDMLCVGFGVALCLNLGSCTARTEGFFAAEVACLSPGASETVLVSHHGWQCTVCFCFS